MKYRNFRNVVAVVAVAAMGGTCYGGDACWQVNLAQEEQDRRVREQAVATERAAIEAQARADTVRQMAHDVERQQLDLAEAAQREQSPGAYWAKAPGLRPVDVDVLALLDRPVVDEIKDATLGKPWKVNVYSNDKKRFNRVTVDLDRDEKADESWTLQSDGAIERNVAEKDNEKYDRHWRLDRASGWVDLDAVAASAQAAALSFGDPPPSTSVPTPQSEVGPPPAQTPGLRAVDSDMLALVKGPAQKKVEDATKGKPYKINLYSDDGQRFNRAKVDLNRNDRWDESWTFGADGSIERKVAPDDDEQYAETLRPEGGAWKKK